MIRTSTLVFLAALSTLPLAAQITVGQNEMPHAGDELYRTRALLNPFLDYASTGAAYTWDFSNLAAGDQDVKAYQTVGSTNLVYALVYADIFFNPNRANHATSGSDIPFYQLLPITDPFTFYYRSASTYTKVGMGAGLAGIPVPITFEDQDEIYELPLQYGDANSDFSSWSISLPTLAHYGYQQTRDTEVDGWGAITTPAGSFDVLRVKSTLAGEDTINIDTLGVGFTIERPLVREYKWLAQGLRVPVLQVNTSEIFGFEVITDIFFYDLPRSIEVVQPLAATLCPGAAEDVTYEVTGVFNEGGFLILENDFIAQLSDANGDFTNAVDIGSIEATGSGVINALIPANTPFGTGYRIRVISTSPEFIGSDNGFDIEINGAAPVATVSANGATEFCAGDAVTLTAGGGNGSYQWQADGLDIPAATNATYDAITSGDYTVVLTNACGTDASDPISVTVNASPEHELLQTSFLSCDGTPVTIEAQDLSGQIGLTYQWYLDGSAVSGETSISILASVAGSYTLEVTNGNTGCGFTTGAATLVLEQVTAPQVTAQGSTDICAGASVSLEADIIIGATYQWYLDGTLIPGATDPTYLAEAAGAYTVIATSANGCASEPSADVTVTVLPAPTAPNVIASDTTTFCAGASVQLLADVIVGATYQWTLDGLDIAGATGTDIITSDGGTYAVVVTGANGCVAVPSNSILVTVNALPAIPVITASLDTLFSSGNGTFQWYLGGTEIVGATNSSLVASISGDYMVTITDANGCSSTSAIYTYISTGSMEAHMTGLYVYPNPNEGLFTIQNDALDECTYTVTEMTGKLVQEGRLMNTRTTLNLGNQASGIYMLQVQGVGVSFRERIVVR
ncbi:MAG: T9SS type A sorting domain-containing protein [Flavobacteriales bacterium]|nr:T9SS type A sorting domain-containing protein [Flavobacteriales bacterium]MBK9540293.1 T9SS type A sorting domain-containing protein [Flavobacteriales bacterium]